ncbi:MAG: putative recombinase [Dehalococcoidia bacterium]|nr:putative recombinase [Dehalococcoidia bacterium]
MRGFLKKRGNSWTIIISLGRDRQTGRYKQHWENVQGTKKEAEARLTALLHSLENGSYVKPTQLTAVEYLQQWLTNQASISIRPSTYRGYESIIRFHFTHAFSSIPLKELQPYHIQKYYSDKLAGGLSIRTVSHHHRLLHTALESAVKQGLLVRNIIDAVDAPKPGRAKLTLITSEDLEKILDSLKGSYYYVPIYTAAYTGLRRGEILGLRWCDLDLDMARLSVNQALYQYKPGQFLTQEPKSAKSRRLVDLPPSLALLLRKYRTSMEAQAVLLGKTLDKTDYVFMAPDGKPILPGTLTQVFIRTTKRLGYSNLRFHDLRHAHASLMLRAGIHPKIVSERLGHATVAFTLDVYSSVAPGLQEQAAKRFDDLLKQKDKKELLANY